MHPTQEKTQLERDYVAVANPIVGHRLIRRFAVEFQWIQEDVERCLDIGQFSASYAKLQISSILS